MEENIFDQQTQVADLVYDVVEVVENETSVVTNNNDKSVFSQVQLKLVDMYQSAKEKMFGEDYWIPNDPFEVVVFPQELLLKAYRPVYPEHRNVSNLALIIVQSVAQSPARNQDPPLYHVVYSYHEGNRQSLSIFRNRNFNDSLDFYRRCDECRVLFKMLDKKKDIRKFIHDITDQIFAHPLWRMIHIAIACQRTDVFTEDGFRMLSNYGFSENDLLNVVCAPEGRYPLMLAIEKNQPQIVKFLLQHGASIAVADAKGNNALHYAARVSSLMLDLLLSFESARDILDVPNNDGLSPVWIAINSGNLLILKTLAVTHGASLSSTTGKNALFEALQSNKLAKESKEVIRVLLDTSPDLLTKRDEATGNTCLHVALFKTPLAALLQLKYEELDLNAKNKAGLAPIHIFATKGDLGLVMTLASYGCNLNETDTNNGATALHIAVSSRNLVLTRLLLCLGADPNVMNNLGDTPRHLAAKIKDFELLRSLVLCGAKRCPASKMGCLAGCVNEERRSTALLKAQSSPSLDDSNKVKNKPQTPPPIEELEHRMATKQQNAKINFIQDKKQDQIYDMVYNKLDGIKEADREKEPYIINALSLDGGGIRGLVITQILMEIEKILGEPLFPYFDWIAGTSTGALVAAGLSTGLSLRHIQWIYLRFKDQIFENWLRPYDSDVLEMFMKAEMGHEKRMSEIRWPRLMFTTTRADVFPVQLELIRNYQLPLSKEENEELGYGDPQEMFLWKALRRSSAAPTYFSWVDQRYVDGGLIANNPTLELLSEIQFWNTVNEQKERSKSVKVGCLLSIGTGVIPTIPFHLHGNISLRCPVSSVETLKNLTALVVDQVTATEGAPVSRASSWCSATETPYFRLSAPLFKDIAMDNKDDQDITKMMWDCMEYMYAENDYIEKLCKMIRKVGLSSLREDFLPLEGYFKDENDETQKIRAKDNPGPAEGEELKPTGKTG